MREGPELYFIFAAEPADNNAAMGSSQPVVSRVYYNIVCPCTIWKNGTTTYVSCLYTV
jgi:hypothetical protein